MQLELSQNEVSELTYILESYVTDLRMEISNTDSKDYRDHLKAREALVKELLGRLGATEWAKPGVSPG